MSAAHLKFGAAGRFPVHDTDLATVISALRCPFAELVGLACERRVDTGCRMRCSTPR
ncbi:MAG TPA: hypothetical protein VN327_00705 [Pseudonocardiaceae bacterium]|nr:hypothetical protein [Pseudonocardiaceae bacterium]